MDCQAYRRKCRECGFRFEKGDNRGYSATVCPECGASLACGKKAIKGYRFCGNHGGPNPSNGFYGLGAGLTTGSGSRFPITRLAAKKAEMEKSGALLTNRKSIDVVRSRLEELLERVDGREMGERLAVLHNLWQKFKKYEAANDIKMLETRAEMDDEFEKAYHDYRSWEQIMDIIDLDRKLVESEVKIAKDLQAILTAEDAYDLVAQFFTIIIRHVQDPVTLKAIEYDITRLIGDRSIIEVEASD